MLAEMADRLHEMCQPLTALQCRLEIGQMNEAAAGQNGAPERTNALWAECLRECHRLSGTVIAMRAVLQEAQAGEQGRKR